MAENKERIFILTQSCEYIESTHSAEHRMHFIALVMSHMYDVTAVISFFASAECYDPCTAAVDDVNVASVCKVSQQQQR